MVSLRQTISLQPFKGCLPKMLLGPFFKTLSHLHDRNTKYYIDNICHQFNIIFPDLSKVYIAGHVVVRCIKN